MTALAHLAALGALLVSTQLPPAARHDERELASPELRVEWAEFKKLYDEGKIEVVDVRGVDAFELGHIPGARSVPLETVGKRAAELGKLNKPIVTYCA